MLDKDKIISEICDVEWDAYALEALAYKYAKNDIDDYLDKDMDEDVKKARNIIFMLRQWKERIYNS